MAYFDWNVNEQCPVTNPKGVQEFAALVHCGRVSVEVQLFDTVFCLPLFERVDWIDAATAGEVNACCNVVSYGGWTISAVAAHSFMDQEGFHQSALNLNHEARLFVGTDTEWDRELSDGCFPVEGNRWRINTGWLGKGRPNPCGYHMGIDVYAESGTPVVCAGDGIVLAVRRFDETKESDDFWGNMLAVADTKGFIYTYCHMDDFGEGLKFGSALAKGQRLGVIGRSGFRSMAYPDHLHFEMYAVRSDRPEFGFDLTGGKRSLPNLVRGKSVAINPLPSLLAWSKRL
ncbi:MAG: M23 family metallopeptidase [Phycisphaerae bacterium]